MYSEKIAVFEAKYKEPCSGFGDSMQIFALFLESSRRGANWNHAVTIF